MAVVTTNLGVVTAYGDAVAAGYTGTKAEWQELMASYATVAEEAAQSATDAETAKNAAVTAKTGAETAKTDAIAAKTAAQAAQTAAETAQGKAETAQGAAEDAAESVSASAAQIATNTSDISDLKSEFTALESDGVVPSAEQILTDKGVTDSVPYHYRKTGGGGADRLYDQIVGGTVCWNQLVGTVTTTTTNGITFTANGDGSITANGTATADITYNVGVKSTGRANHVRMLTGAPAGGSTSTYYVKDGYGNYTDSDLGAFIEKSNAGDSIYQIRIKNGVTMNNVKYIPQIFDLTAMFGSTIADYIYQLEQTHTGDGVAFFKALFPNDYYEYNVGELVSVSGLSAHVMRDVDDNIIRTYPLDSTLTLRGVPKLVDGKMCFDGDTYESDGTVTRKYGIVDLGTLNWTKSTSIQNLFTCTKLSDMKIYLNTVVADWMSSNYKITSGNTLETTDKSIAMLNTSSIYVNDSAFTDATAEQFKTAMSGVMLVYPLATPTTEEAEPYQHLQQCDPSGTEEYVSTGIVPVGHNSFYPENLRAKVEQLPWNFANLIAPTESAFVATRNYVTGDLFIVSNVLYKATSNIANGGTITPNTNVTATTLADVIAALS